MAYDAKTGTEQDPWNARKKTVEKIRTASEINSKRGKSTKTQCNKLKDEKENTRTKECKEKQTNVPLSLFYMDSKKLLHLKLNL